MLWLAPLSDKEKIKEYFALQNAEYTENSGCLTATEGKEVLGYCLYYLDSKKMTVLKIEPQNDIALADGILRSTLHVATEKFITDAYYSDTVNTELLNKIGFIKNAEKKQLDTDKLFQSCCSCKN